MSERFRVEKSHCESHDMDFEKRITIKVSCQRYQQCQKEAIQRHETNIAETRHEAEKEGRQWAAAKAVIQIVCPYDVPPKHFP